MEMSLYPSLERLDYLAAQIAEMALTETKRSQLGNIAIELLVARERAEEKIEGDYPKEEKEEAERILKQIRRMEKSIVQLYLIDVFRGTTKKKGQFFDYIMDKYVSR